MVNQNQDLSQCSANQRQGPRQPECEDRATLLLGPPGYSSGTDTAVTHLQFDSSGQDWASHLPPLLHLQFDSSGQDFAWASHLPPLIVGHTHDDIARYYHLQFVSDSLSRDLDEWADLPPLIVGHTQDEHLFQSMSGMRYPVPDMRRRLRSTLHVVGPESDADEDCSPSMTRL